MDRRSDILSDRERMKNLLEVKLLLKNAKIKNNIIDSRNKARDELYKRFKKRENRLKDAKIISELLVLKKVNSIKQRQMSRDIRDIKYKFQSIHPNFNNNDIYEINNSKNYMKDKVNYYSGDRRKYIDEIKNKFYNKNYGLKNSDNIIYNLNKIDNDLNQRKISDNNSTNNYYNHNHNHNYNEGINNYNYDLKNNDENEYINNNFINNNNNINGINVHENNNNGFNEGKNNIFNDENERKIKLQKIIDSYKNK
jgi:hypothetical protein